VALLKDSQPGLRCAAALALGKCGASSAADAWAVDFRCRGNPVDMSTMHVLNI
jgi:hypothetical protein